MAEVLLYQLQEFDGPVLLNFPHSGTYIPEKIAAQLNERGLAVADTDWHVPKLYEFAKGQVSWLQATHSRYVVDLNRDPNGSSLYPGQAGTGFCPVESFDGYDIYDDGKRPDRAETSYRQQRFFNPYHQQLRTQIERIKNRFGVCVLLDCHSIKSEVPRLFEGVLPDLNLGTFSGASCDPDLASAAVDVLGNAEFSLVRDQRFKGGWITRHYGQPETGVHALQLEISQNIYMDEVENFEFQPKQAASLRQKLQELVNRLNIWAKNQRETMR